MDSWTEKQIAAMETGGVTGGRKHHGSESKPEA